MNVPANAQPIQPLEQSPLSERPQRHITETLFSSSSTVQVCSALAIAQGKFAAPKRTKTATVTPRDGGKGYTFSYAPLDEIINAIKDGLAENGLCRQQYLIRSQAGYVIRTIIWHSSGEWLGGDYPVFYQREGAQGFAGGVTYARRNGLSLMLGLAPEDDDDGNTAEDNDVQVVPRQAPATRRRANPPQPPAANVMQQPTNDNQPTDEQAKQLMEYDRGLAAAAQKGMLALEEQWGAIPNQMRPALKAALEKRHKVVAMSVDNTPVSDLPQGEI